MHNIFNVPSQAAHVLQVDLLLFLPLSKNIPDCIDRFAQTDDITAHSLFICFAAHHIWT